MKRTQRLNMFQQTLKCYEPKGSSFHKLPYFLLIGLFLLTNSITAQQTVNFCPGDVIDLTALETGTGTYTYNDCSNSQVVTGDFLYLPSSSCTSVSLIDLSNNTIISSFEGGSSFNSSAVVGPNGLLYVANRQNNTVTVLDPSNNHSLVTTIPAMSPISLSIDNNTGYVYAAGSSSNELTIIDSATNMVINTLVIGGANTIAFANGLVYVTQNSGLSIVDPNNGFNVTGVSLPGNISDLVVAPNGNLYISSFQGTNGFILEYDVTTNMVVNSIPLGLPQASPKNLEIDANGYIYVHSLNTDIIQVIDTNTNTVIASPSGFSLNTNFILNNIAVAPNGLVYVSHYLFGTSQGIMSIIDPNNNFSVTHNVLAVQPGTNSYGDYTYSGTVFIASPIPNTTTYMPTTGGEQVCYTYLNPISQCNELGTITFALDPSCAPVCALTDADLVLGDCLDAGTPTDPNDDTFFFTLNPTGTDLGTTGYSFTDAGGNYTGSGTYGGALGNFGPFPISSGAQTITITDMDDTNCTIDVLVTPPPPCSNTLPCAADVGTFPGRD